jgi:hypothetical protein
LDFDHLAISSTSDLIPDERSRVVVFHTPPQAAPRYPSNPSFVGREGDGQPLIRSLALVADGRADLLTDRVQGGDAANLKVGRRHDMDFNEIGASDLGDITGVPLATSMTENKPSKTIDIDPDNRSRKIPEPATMTLIPRSTA